MYDFFKIKNIFYFILSLKEFFVVLDIDDLVIDLIKFFVFFLIIFKFFWLIGFKFSVVKILFILFGLFKLLIIVEKNYIMYLIMCFEIICV